jgi:hypothetical protein
MVIDLNQCSDGSMGQIYARNGSTGQISEATKGQQEMLNANAKLCEQKKESTEGGENSRDIVCPRDRRATTW